MKFTTEELQQKNKIINRFLSDTTGMVINKQINIQFQNNWDLMMNVIRKIQSKVETPKRHGVLISITTTHISITYKDFKYLSEPYKKGKFDPTWKYFDILVVFDAVSKFLEYYYQTPELQKETNEKHV